MYIAVLILCTLLLSLERITYYFVWRHPAAFRVLCEHRLGTGPDGPLNVLQGLFYFFKALQLATFILWCTYFAGGFPMPTGEVPAIVAGVALIVLGMVLNFAVFLRLGKTGVFYGNRLGYHVPWREGFPFSLSPHPQYIGAVLSIWGLFLIMRYPHPDWIVLPVVETVLYTLGARHEK